MIFAPVLVALSMLLPGQPAVPGETSCSITGVRPPEASCSLTNAYMLDLPVPVIRPTWSRDGLSITVSGLKGAGLYRVDVLTGDSRSVVRCTETPAAASGCTYFQREDAIWSRCEGEEARLTDGSDRFFDPLLSPDGTKLVATGLYHGLYMADLGPKPRPAAIGRYRGLYVAQLGSTPRFEHIGAGGSPAWFSDSRRIAFDVTEDDGLRITASDIWIYNVITRVKVRVTDTPDVAEMHPSPSPDGTALAFEAGLSAYVADLECTD